MLEKSSNNIEKPAMEWSGASKAALLLLNALPLFHLIAVGMAMAYVPGWLGKTGVFLAGIYLLPPLVVRLVLACHPLQAGSHALNSPDFLFWWATAQCQILFCRLPALEEVLRFFPGLYSFWLRLWGAKIGRLTYWAPGLQILDRSFLQIGDDVIFGTGVKLNPHVITDNESGTPLLHLATISVGGKCRIGGYSLLTAGSTVETGQTLKAFTLMPPFSIWREGRRLKIAVPQ